MTDLFQPFRIYEYNNVEFVEISHLKNVQIYANNLFMIVVVVLYITESCDLQLLVT